MRPIDADVVFNIVWTGSVFPYLRLFVASQLHHSGARFRFVANGCPHDQVELMERYAADHPERVIDVIDVSEVMVAHGVALDRVRALRDDGELLGLIDPDIKANAPFLPEFLPLLDDHDAVTSGTEVFSDHNVVPVGHKGVAGEHFFDANGFVFGSPHLAIYRRGPLEETCGRWGVGFGTAGPELTEQAKARLAELGHRYAVYDTGKILNALFQADGHPLVHLDLPQLVHIGGLSHFLAPPGDYVTNPDTGEREPGWSRWKRESDRYDVAKFTARCLIDLCGGGNAPSLPADAPPALAAKLELVRSEAEDLVARY